MEKLCLRDDGICHSPLDQAAWGRGNGFAALGTCLSLCELPPTMPPERSCSRRGCRHLRALLKHQDAGGDRRQVIDRPESYREFTSTCMISFALVSERGWLPEDEFAPAARRAWQAIKLRVGPAGRLVDVCRRHRKNAEFTGLLRPPRHLGKRRPRQQMGLLIANEWAAASKLVPVTFQGGR